MTSPRPSTTRSDRRFPNGSRAALSLLYAGGLPEHAEMATGILRDLGIRATFAIDPAEVVLQVPHWRDVFYFGHEAMNGSLAGYASEEGLTNWTRLAVEHELHLANKFIREELDATAKGVWVPSERPHDAQGSYEPLLSKTFEYAVGPVQGVNVVRTPRTQLRSSELLEYPLSTIRELQNTRSLRWTIIRIDGLFNGTDNQRILAHRLLIEAIARNRSNIWVAPVGEVWEAMKAARLQNVADAAVEQMMRGMVAGIKPELH